MRDYIHVMDLAEGHCDALDCLLAEEPHLLTLTLNLGSGQGQSVLEVVKTMEAASGRPIPYAIIERRDGDTAISVAEPSKAAQRLGWQQQNHQGNI